MTRRRITVALSKPGATISGCFDGELSATALESLRAIGEACLAREAASNTQDVRHEGDDPWQRYERRKAELASTTCSTAEYELELGRIADEEGV